MRKKFQSTTVQLARALASLGRNDFASTGALQGSYGALVAAPIEDNGQLIEFATQDFQPEIKSDKLNFVAMGSGQTLAEPFMSFVSRTFWEGKTPDVQTALFGVHWALAHTIKCAPAFVGDPIVLATLTNGKRGWKAELVPEEALGEQSEHIAEIEKRIAGYRVEMLGPIAAEIVPKP